MDRLWAPWRTKYVQTKKRKECIFCEGIKSSLKAKRSADSSEKYKCKNYVITQGRYSFSMLNIFPYNNGHVMVSPKRHVREFSLLKDAEALDLLKTLNKVKRMLDKILKPHGYNIGINMAKAGGAGITGHLHIHIVPRWEGDTNFMPTLYNTKIISQSLDELYKLLKNQNNKIC